MDLNKLTRIFGSADCVAHALTKKLPKKNGLYATVVNWQNKDEYVSSKWNRFDTLYGGFDLGLYMYKFGNDTISELQKNKLAKMTMSKNEKAKVGLSPQDNPNFTTTVLIRIVGHRVYTTIGMGVHTIDLLVDRRDDHILLNPDKLPSEACWASRNRVQQLVDILGTIDLLYQENDYCVYDY